MYLYIVWFSVTYFNDSLHFQSLTSIPSKAKLVQAYPCPTMSNAKKHGCRRTSLRLLLYTYVKIHVALDGLNF